MSPARRGEHLRDLEILEDLAEQRGPQEGFLKLYRYRVRNVYSDGSKSEPYPCDVISRPAVDAVTVVLFERSDAGIRVGLRENLRPPIWLRRRNEAIPFPEENPPSTLLETVAGVLEASDSEHPKELGLCLRAAAECQEEVGLSVKPEAILPLGGASFPSPGVADEMVYFCAAQVDFALAQPPQGDGSTMEEVGGLVILKLHEAIARCRDGRIPDMKTEIGLIRLRDWLDA
ncbi:MAG: NUDIX hydrolase [Planctomycetota bacterium]|nr:MAG: NUDIX hydrolase [Planctomycetota bacterium]